MPDVAKRFTTANELHLPVGRDARIELVAGDVIHSLWMPSLSGKRDLIPGRTNTITLTPAPDRLVSRAVRGVLRTAAREDGPGRARR